MFSCRCALSLRSLALSAALFMGLCGPLLAQFEVRATLSPQGNYPSAGAVGDFNRDGNLDLAVAEFLDSQVTILLGNGDGTFRVGASYAVGYEASAITAADFRHNGVLDLAVVSEYDSFVYVLLGNGDGTFQDAIAYPAIGLSLGLTVGDFTGDGKLDIAAITQSQTCGCISVYPGNGDGTFGPAVISTLPAFAMFGLSSGRFIPEGKLDLAAVGSLESSGVVEIALGNGDGTFTSDGSYDVFYSPQSVAVADLNGDKKMDLAVGDYGGGSISVLLGNGDGTFQSPVTYSSGSSAVTWVVAQDLDGDGIPDLATSDYAFAPGVSVLKGNGDGTFQPAKFYPVGKGNTYVIARDFNGDGLPDLVLVDYTGGAVITMLNTGVVSFSPSTPISPPTTLLGATSPPRSTTLTNNGTSPLTISSVKSSGSPFHMKTTCQGSIAPGGSCTITATFSAQVEGVTTGTVSIHDSASSKAQVVELVGTGTGVKLVPTGLTFPAQKVGTKSQPQTIELTNIGSGALDFTRTIYVGGNDFNDFLESNNCGTQISAGASCTITITFKPLKTGMRTAQVIITDDGGGSPQIVPLTGTGS